MEKEDFDGKIGETFAVLLEEDQRTPLKSLDLKLQAVDPLKKKEGADHVPNLRKTPFSLIFVGPEESHLPDDSYKMSVKGWEDQIIFISAFKLEKGKGIFYDAVFN